MPAIPAWRSEEKDNDHVLCNQRKRQWLQRRKVGVRGRAGMGCKILDARRSGRCRAKSGRPSCDKPVIPDAPRHDPRTDAQRAAKYKRSGRQIACVIRDPDALAALNLLSRKVGGVTAAIT